LNSEVHTSDTYLSVETFENLRKHIYDQCGIYFQDNKKYMLEARLSKRISHLRLNSFEAYLNYLKYNVNKENEKKYLFDAITINETYFFRNQPQLDALVTKVIPEIIEQKQKAGKNRIRIWSAASSSGEEAYSIAISILDFIKIKYPDFEFEITGTDISHAAIEAAKNGIYKDYAVRSTPAHYLKKYFKAKGNVYHIDPSVKQMVQFRFLNLYDDSDMKTMMGIDIIFCANVLIYFDINSKIKVVSSLYNSLNRGGY